MKIQFIKDTVGNNYVGVVVHYNKVVDFLNKMYEIIPDEYSEYLGNQQSRDHGQYHITVLNVAECNMISNKIGMDKYAQRIQNLTDIEINDIKYYGLGKATRNENTAFYIVIKSNTLDEIRKSFELKPKDFHVTVGFKWKDVHGVDKGISTIVEKKSTFLELLGNKWKENENWFFLKDLVNIDFDRIKIISITKTLITIVCPNNIQYQIGLIGDTIKAQTECEKNYVKSKGLSTYEIRRILD